MFWAPLKLKSTTNQENRQIHVFREPSKFLEPFVKKNLVTKEEIETYQNREKLINVFNHSNLVRKFKYKDITFRPQQNQNILRLLTFKNWAIFDDMGTGKTHSVLGALHFGKKEFKKIILIPASKSIFFQWLDWGKNHLDLNMIEMKGNKEKRKEIYEDFHKQKEGILIISKELVQQESHIFLNKNYDLIIIDEAHFLVNKSTRYNKIVELRKKCKYAWVLTGTPLERNLLDMVGILHFLYPISSYYQLKSYYGVEVIKYLGNKEIRTFELNQMKKNELLELINLISSKTNIKDVYSNYTKPIEEIIKINMDDKQKEYYKQLEKTFLITKKEQELNLFDNKGILVQTQGILDQFIRLHQLALDPRIIIDDYNQKSPKSIWIIDFIKKTDKSVLIFSRYRKYLEILEKDLIENNISVNLFSGKLKTDTKRDYVNAFNKGETQVLLVQDQAGGQGLRLQKAFYTLRADLNWRISINKQINERFVDTENNKITKEIYYLESKNSIDGYIKRAVENKETETSILKNFFKYLNRKDNYE